MPIYEDEQHSREELDKLRRKNVCAECGGKLGLFYNSTKKLAFLACWEWTRSHHDGIAREPHGEFIQPIIDRRKDMVQEHGEAKTRVLMKYEGVVSLTKQEANEILLTIWPKAPEVERQKAALICMSYGLNPLMKHIFLIPFKSKDGMTWATVLGIKATRLMAGREKSYSYVDETPRIMTEDEQKKTFGEVDENSIRAITILNDEHGHTFRGYGSWPKDNQPYGTDKGNTKANMAFIRSERNAFERMSPGEMPQGVEVMEEEVAATLSQENVIEGEGRVIPDDEPIETRDTPAPKPTDTPDKPAPAKGKEPKNIKELLEWVASHGKQYGPTWLCKELNVNATPQIADINEAYLKIKEVMKDW
jgi:hypothetical protein